MVTIFHTSSTKNLNTIDTARKKGLEERIEQEKKRVKKDNRDSQKPFRCIGFKSNCFENSS